MYRRHIEHALEDALADTPVVLICGARQVGKSTLVQQSIELHPARAYLTLDDASSLPDAPRVDVFDSPSATVALESLEAARPGTEAVRERFGDDEPFARF